MGVEEHHAELAVDMEELARLKTFKEGSARYLATVPPCNLYLPGWVSTPNLLRLATVKEGPARYLAAVLPCYLATLLPGCLATLLPLPSRKGSTLAFQGPLGPLYRAMGDTPALRACGLVTTRPSNQERDLTRHC